MPFLNSTFLASAENYQIKDRLKENHTERIEVFEVNKDFYRSTGQNKVVYYTMIPIFVVLLYAIIVGVLAFGLGFGFLLLLLVFLGLSPIFYLIVKRFTIVKTFYITDSELIIEEIVFKRVKTTNWDRNRIKKLMISNNRNSSYSVSALFEEEKNLIDTIDSYKAETLISVPQSVKNLAYCEEFMASFKKYGLPVDSTAVTSIGASKRFKVRKVEDKKAKKVTKIRTIIENEGEIKCFACGNMNPSISSYCMNCGSSL